MLIGFLTPWLGLVVPELLLVVLGHGSVTQTTQVVLQLILTSAASVLAGWWAAAADHSEAPRHHLLALGGIVLFAVVVLTANLLVVDVEPGGPGRSAWTLIAAPLAALGGGAVGLMAHDRRARSA